MPRSGRAARALTITAAALVLVAAEPRARAANSVQGTAEVALGWTDNVFNAPSPPYAPVCDAAGNCTATPPACDPAKSSNCAPGSPLPRYSDFFFQLRPGIAFATGAARAVQRLAYNFNADLFVSHPAGNSYTNTLDWNGFFIPSKKTELMVGLQSQEGRINTLNLQNTADTTALGVSPSNATATTFFSQGANEALVDHINNQWNFAQSLTFLAFIPLSPRTLPDTYTTTVDVGAERLFALDAVGLDLRSEYVVYGATRDPTTGAVGPLQQQVIDSAIARWRRDWSHFWSTEAALGLVMAMNAADGSERIWQPYALAVARYFNERATGELRYEHNIVPNPLSGATFVADQATLRLTVPFPQKSRLFLSGSGGYEHAQLYNQDGSGGLRTGLVATAEIVLADASLTWQATGWLGVFARYEFYRQFGHPSDQGFMQPNIERNIVLVGVAGIYPVAAAARVPNRPGLRVDRADMPMIPEPHSLPAVPH
jgi:hypothetical protein